jgi:hypothetical protein
MRTNILAPLVQSETSATFYLNGRIFEMSGDSVSLVETSNNANLNAAIAAFETFEFSENNVRWYLGTSRFNYNIAENKFTWGNSEIVSESFSKHIFAGGAIRYENLKTAELFEAIPAMLESFIVLDMVACFEGNNITVDLIKADEKLYVSRNNKGNHIYKFFEAKNANEALEYVKEQTGQDASEFLIESLEGEASTLANIQAQINEFQETIAFLKDQRNVLAEADRNLPEIKEANNFLLSEIKSFETKIAELQA